MSLPVPVPYLSLALPERKRERETPLNVLLCRQQSFKIFAFSVKNLLATLHVRYSTLLVSVFSHKVYRRRDSGTDGINHLVYRTQSLAFIAKLQKPLHQSTNRIELSFKATFVQEINVSLTKSVFYRLSSRFSPLAMNYLQWLSVKCDSQGTGKLRPTCSLRVFYTSGLIH